MVYFTLFFRQQPAHCNNLLKTSATALSKKLQVLDMTAQEKLQTPDITASTRSTLGCANHRLCSSIQGYDKANVKTSLA